MIPKLMRKPFRLISNLQVDHKQSNGSSASMAVGLGIILTQISSQGKKSSNIVVKSELSLRQKPSVASSLEQQQQQYSCFLKACHLCNKGLSLDKEVYMYRGDVGFCSIVCRDRQIVLDEMREMETSTKKVLAAYRRRSCRILEQHEKIPPRRTIFAL